MNSTANAADINVQGKTAQVYQFNKKQELRAILIDGEPWFVAADLCAALGISNNRDAVAKLDSDEKGVGLIDTPGGAQEMLVVNESGMNAIILRCRDAMKPGTPAHSYRKWVTAEVLPAIRKYGMYLHAPAMRPALTNEHWQEVYRAAHSATSGWAIGGHAKNWIFNHMRVAFSVARFEDVPDDQFETVMQLIKSKEQAARDFHVFMTEARDWFEKEVLGGGQPWTPTIKSKLTRQLKRQVILPPKVDWLALAKQVDQKAEGGAAA